MVIGLVGRYLHLLLQSHLADLHSGIQGYSALGVGINLLVELHTSLCLHTILLFHSVKITVLYLQLFGRYMCTYINFCNISPSFISDCNLSLLYLIGCKNEECYYMILQR